MMMEQALKLLTVAKFKLKQLFTDENGEVNIVAIVILIGIAVTLALIFKDKIVELLESLFGTIDEKANNAVSGN